MADLESMHQRFQRMLSEDYGGDINRLAGVASTQGIRVHASCRSDKTGRLLIKRLADYVSHHQARGNDMSSLLSELSVASAQEVVPAVKHKRRAIKRPPSPERHAEPMASPERAPSPFSPRLDMKRARRASPSPAAAASSVPVIHAAAAAATPASAVRKIDAPPAMPVLNLERRYEELLEEAGHESNLSRSWNDALLVEFNQKLDTASLQNLAPEGWLNDVLVMLLLHITWKSASISEETRRNSGLIDCQVVKGALLPEPHGWSSVKIQRAMKKMLGPALSARRLFLPCNTQNMHWFGVVLDRQLKTAFVYDSLNLSSSVQLANRAITIIGKPWAALATVSATEDVDADVNDNWFVEVVEPTLTQDNGSDCGLCMCTTFRMLLEAIERDGESELLPVLLHYAQSTWGSKRKRAEAMHMLLSYRT